ncbi:acyl-coenzyme A thioesterase 13 isoform X2 [Mesoplodon densirostris]|uniref:acyl-coenzyme A thioesterase 13 isoform X2 n=1 Tax=Mesoplodon densirostris TaxID=48708 RepID=UPI0028DBF9CF|nr:acyl-coenzyme A thioesterase 13 isoform X2 [Mesoplodon densirostris]
MRKRAPLSEDDRAPAQPESGPGLAKAKQRVRARSQRGAEHQCASRGRGCARVRTWSASRAQKAANLSPFLSLFFCEFPGFPALPRIILEWDLGAGERSTMSCKAKSLLEAVKFSGKALGFDRSLEKVTVVSAVPGKVICEVKVEEQHTNKMGTLHGGMTATLVDAVSTYALLCTERGAPGVSVDMNITYMSPAKMGEDIVITAHVLKQGKTLAFLSVDLTNKATGKLIAQGRHTKHLGN